MAHFQKHSFGPWGGIIRKQLSWSTVTVGLPVIPERELIEVDTSPLLKMDVIREIGFLERCGAHGLSSSFKIDGEVLTSELTTSGITPGKGRDFEGLV